MTRVWCKSFVLLSALVTVALGCGYSTCPAHYDPGKLQLHIISHSHDDVGWLTTPDGYADNDVNPLLSHVVQALAKNSARKFVEVEMYYFKRWWQRQTNATHQKVKALVSAGQLTFANGGWCINDEASAHYNQIIDQMTLGIQFLRDTFGECAEPKLSWQIDPFGASREQANLFAQMGFDGHVTNRGNGHLRNEFIWNTSLSHSIFTTHLHRHYSAPNGFNFEDADEITEHNKHNKANQLVELAKKWNADYGHKGHVLIPFGDDFRYKHAERWFSNLDKLIEVVNKEHPDVHLQYSSPHCYIKAIRDLKPKLDVRSEDYFPLWTGYYSSRPQVKYLDRFANNLLQAAKQLEVFSELGNTQDLLYEGKNQLAVLQHHDAVSGTSREFVMFDYKERLVNAIRSIQQVISQALYKLTRKSDFVKPHEHVGPFVYTTVNISDYVQHLENEGFATVVYNPVVQQQQTWVRIPVSEHSTYKVFDSNGPEVKHVSAVPISSKVKALIGHHAQITHELVFSANLPALGFTTFFVTRGTDLLHENSQKVPTNKAGNYVLKGKNFELEVDKESGQPKSIVKDGVAHKLVQTFAYYPAHHSSSAYEFCPTGGAIDLSAHNSEVAHVAKYEGFAEVTQKVNDWIWQTIRVYEDKEYVEFDQTVGPVDDHDQKSKEVITRFETDLDTKGRFYTDANGRQDIERHRTKTVHECGGQRNTIWYNYFPVTTAAYIKDLSSGLQLTLIPDRSVGASSQKDGELELMIHRRLLDHLGLDINMNDKDVDGKGVVARGKVFLYLSNKQEAADNLRRANRDVFMQPVIAFNPLSNIEAYKVSHNVEYSTLKAPLPDNVHLLTLENWGDVKNNEVLVRFENFYQPTDESKLNTVAHVALNAFAGVNIESVSKTNLVGGARQQVNANVVNIGAQEIASYVYKVKRTLVNSGCGFKWEKLVDHKLPLHAIRAGHEPNSNTPLYVCRHKNVDLIPGKYNQGLHCRVSYGGKEVAFDDNEVEILTAANTNYQWVPRHGGDPFAEGAFIAGHHEDGRPIYIGRCAKFGVVVGKIDEYFYYPFGGHEHKAHQGDCLDHEILAC